MATYKDPYNLTFNPYVQQRPVEAMMKVGVYKQERYDQGVQKIQESIDNIAGLDVVRPEDKQYLQSKLNQLGGQLSMVAGGDFSNFQLVNSVNGMTNQIVKDPTVTNAVSNTAKYRKDLETVAKLQQEGKWGDSNQLAFNKDANAWFQGGLDASYSANTSPYVNTTKEVTDIVKALAKDYTKNDVWYDPETGQVLDVMTQQKVEGITPEKIQTALKAGLSPQAWRQLAIDGQYKYSNVSPEQYVNDINNSYQKTFSLYSDRRDELMNDAKLAPTQEEKDRIMLQVDEIDRSIKSIKSDYDSVSRGFESGDVEGSQAQFYTTNWLENISNAMSSRGVSSELKVNPFFTTDMQVKNSNLQIRRFNETKRHNQATEDLAYAKILQDQMANDPFGPLFPMPDTPDDPTKIIQTANANVKKTGAIADVELQKLSDTFGWSTELYQEKDDNGNLVKDDNGNPVMTSQAIKEATKLINVGRNELNAQVYDMAEAYYNADQAYTQELARVNSANTEAETNVPYNVDDAIPSEFKNNTYFGYTPADAALLFDKFDTDYLTKEYVPGSASEGKPLTIPVYNDKAAQTDLRGDENAYRLYEEWKSPQFASETKQEVLKIQNAVQQEATRVNTERKKVTSEILYQNTPMWQRTRVPIVLEKPAVKARVDDYIGTIVGAEGGWPGLSDDDIEKLAAMKGKVDAASFITKDKLLNVQSGGESINIPYTDEQWAVLTQKFSNQVNKNSYVQRFEGEVLPQLLVTNPALAGNKAYWTTAYADESGKSSFDTTPYNAYLKSFSFPSIRSYNVSGNFVTTVNPREDFNNGYFYLNVSGFKLRDNRTGQIVDSAKLNGALYPQAMTKAQAADFMKTATDKQIEALIKRQFPNGTLVK
jgi:hypothetical protein